MHCARLGFERQELLTTGRLNLPVEGEPAEWLRAVRRGDVAFEDWWEIVLRLDEELADLEGDNRLPPAPDRARIERWTIAAHQAVWELLGE